MYLNDLLHVYSCIIININGLNIMVTLGVYFEYITVVLTLNPAAPENGIIFSLSQAVPAGQIKSFVIS